MIDDKHFREFTLTEGDVKNFAIAFGIVLAVLMTFAKVFVKDNKALGWTLSLVNSGVMTVAGTIYFFKKKEQFPNMMVFVPGGRDIVHSVDNFSALMCMWFAMANIVDLAFGSIFYPKYVQLLTGYVHHTVFIWIMLASTTGNGLFLTCEPFAAAFCLMTLEELPTFLLALGSVDSRFRTDFGFGITFFSLRICYHAYFLAYCIWSGMNLIVDILLTLTLMLHLHWFSTWVSKYAFPKKKKV
jgi:hypothetical protein